jgi:hypothetical protein
MDSRPIQEIRCQLCSKPVCLETDLSADENGKAVHTGCYVKRLTGAHDNSPAICAAD